MWYDKYHGPPAPNSPLESLFILVKLRRMEAELLSTRAQIHAALSKDGSMDPVIKAFQEYADKMFPFLANAQDTKLQDEKKALEKFSRTKARINLREVYKGKAQRLKSPAPPKHINIKPKMPGLR